MSQTCRFETTNAAPAARMTNPTTLLTMESGPSAVDQIPPGLPDAPAPGGRRRRRTALERMAFLIPPGLVELFACLLAIEQERGKSIDIFVEVKVLCM